jgi:hypothetical protein
MNHISLLVFAGINLVFENCPEGDFITLNEFIIQMNLMLHVQLAYRLFRELDI